ERGELNGAIAAYLDITDLAHAEAALRESEARFRAALKQIQVVTDLMSAGVTRCNADLHYEWVSRRYADWIGRAPEEINGRSIREVMGDAAFEAVLPHFRDVLAGNHVEFEREVEYASIGRRWVHAAYVPTRNASGAVDGWVAVVTDITERKRAQ